MPILKIINKWKLDEVKLLVNQLLISTPNVLDDPAFEKVVVYVCEHSADGAVGLIVNRPTEFNLQFVFEQLGINNPQADASQQPVLFGGPVQQDRGFVIHRPFKNYHPNLDITDDICVSTSKDILKKIANGEGPDDVLVTLGYAGWAANQLDEEIRNNTWLTCAANEELMYEVPFDLRWQYALDSMGLDITKLVLHSGNA